MPMHLHTKQTKPIEKKQTRTRGPEDVIPVLKCVQGRLVKIGLYSLRVSHSQTQLCQHTHTSVHKLDLEREIEYDVPV
jgi:hypothetical protein